MKGFTLLEFLTTTVILSITLSVGIPSMITMVEKYRASHSLNTLQSTLTKARLMALEKTEHTLVCPMMNDRCVDDWSKPLAAFNDRNENLALDQDDVLLFKSSNENDHGYWQKKRVTQNFVKFNPQGHAFSSATTFLYCPTSGKKEFAKQLVINFQGRIRVNSYLNPQGQPYQNVSPLGCLTP